MKKLWQQNEYDCFRTCVACIVDEDISTMPTHVGGVRLDKLSSPNARWNIWSKKHGYEIKAHPHIMYDDGEYYIGVLSSYDGTGNAHCVVCYNDEVVHDPEQGDIVGMTMFAHVTVRKVTV